MFEPKYPNPPSDEFLDELKHRVARKGWDLDLIETQSLVNALFQQSNKTLDKEEFEDLVENYAEWNDAHDPMLDQPHMIESDWFTKASKKAVRSDGSPISEGDWKHFVWLDISTSNTPSDVCVFAQGTPKEKV